MDIVNKRLAGGYNQAFVVNDKGHILFISNPYVGKKTAHYAAFKFIKAMLSDK